MRKLFWAVCLAALAPAASVWAQELVIFRDYRSLAVLSHRVSGGWTYLRLSEGELAVMTKTIREFRKEPSSPSGAVQVSAPISTQPQRRDWRSEQPPPPPVEPETDNYPDQEPEPEPVAEEPPPLEEPPPPPLPPMPTAPEQVKPFQRPDMKRSTIGRSLS